MHSNPATHDITPMIIISGLSKTEMLVLEHEMSNNVEQIDYLSVPGSTFAAKHPNIHREFVSAVIITIAATNVALNLIKLWLNNKKAPKSNNLNIAVQLRDDTIVRIEKDSLVIEYPDCTIVKIDTLKENDKKLPEKLKPFEELLDSVQNMFKEFKT